MSPSDIVALIVTLSVGLWLIIFPASVLRFFAWVTHRGRVRAGAKLSRLDVGTFRLGGIVWVLLVLYGFGDAFIATEAASVQKKLEQEFNAIRPLAGARLQRYQATHRDRQALVDSTYSTDLSYAEIRQHYDAELASRGWRFHREQPLRDWGRDFGGRTVEYCKQGYAAALQYAGDRARYGWAFGLDLSWGLPGHECSG